MFSDLNYSMKFNWLPWLWLALGTLFTFLSNGRWTISIATWLAFIFMLRYVRTQKPVIGLFVGGVITILAYIVGWKGLIPVKGVYYFVISGSIGIIYWLPFVVDRLFSPKIKGLTSTLLFPFTFVTIELISLLTNPYLTWGSIAYTQYHFILFKQLVSLTGLSGIVFMVTWFGSVVNWAWEQKFVWKKIWKGIIIYTVLIVSILTYGGVRLMAKHTQAPVVRIAGISINDELIEEWLDIFKQPDDVECILQTILNDYFFRSEKVSELGVDLIMWDEGAILLPERMEDDIIQQGQQFAKDKQIYLLMPLMILPADAGSFMENKILLVDPDGKIRFEYNKSAIVPGDGQKKGRGILPVEDTALGKIGAAICFDMDDSRLIQQAGAAHIDLLLVPADDWEAIDPIHSRMASFRAIENGCSLVRTTREAVSESYDSRGQVLASASVETPDHIMIANVNVQASWTLYPNVKELFALLNMAGLIVMLIIGCIRNKKNT